MEFGPVIKNPVLDINKLVLQGTMLNHSVQNVDGDSTADQATTDLLAKKDPVIHEISVGMSGEEASLYTVSGTPPLSLPNSLGKPLKAWEVDVLPYQEGTGDPAPDNVRPIHGTDKLTITTAGKNLFGGETLADAIATKVPSAVKDTTNKTIKYTAQAIDDVIIVEGIFKPNTRYTVIVNGTNASQQQVPNLKFTYTDGTSSTVGQFVGGVIAVTTEAGMSVRSLDGNWSTGTTTLNYELCGIFEGELTADQFEPYVGASTTLTLPQTVYTGTIGSEGGERMSAEVDLGSLTWTYADNNGRWNHPLFFANVSTNKIVHSNSDICEKYAYSDVEPRILENEKFATANNTFIYIRDDSITNIADFITANAGVKFVYNLATSEQFLITTPIIPTPTGTATTWATAEDGIVDGMEVTYYKSE